MLRHPVQLTSLEEDFKKLGLLNEQEEVFTQSGNGPPAPIEKRGPTGKPGHIKTGSRNVGAQSEGDGDEGFDGNETVPGHEGADTQGNPTGKGAVKPPLPTVPGAQKESITGGDTRRQRLRGEASEEDDDDGEEDDDKKKSKKDDDGEEDDDKDESIELTGSNRVLEALRSARGEKTESSQTPSSHLDKVAALIEDVNSIMESIDTSHREDAVRAFANASIISEMLAKGFAHFAEQYDDEDFANTAEAFATMSEDAASVAHVLEEGEELDPEALQEEFRAQMDALMEGLDFYSDVVESDAELDEEEGLEEDEEETEVEEDSEGEQDESSSMSQYRKKFGANKKGVGTYKATEDTEGEQDESGSMSQYRKKFGMKKKGVGTYKATEDTDTTHRRATGGIVSQRAIGETYFRQGKMGPEKKLVNREKNTKTG